MNIEKEIMLFLYKEKVDLKNLPDKGFINRFKKNKIETLVKILEAYSNPKKSFIQYLKDEIGDVRLTLGKMFWIRNKKQEQLFQQLLEVNKIEIFEYYLYKYLYESEFKCSLEED